MPYERKVECFKVSILVTLQRGQTATFEHPRWRCPIENCVMRPKGKGGDVRVDIRKRKKKWGSKEKVDGIVACHRSLEKK